MKPRFDSHNLVVADALGQLQKLPTNRDATKGRNISAVRILIRQQRNLLRESQRFSSVRVSARLLS
jgi:hypothetical protein